MRILINAISAKAGGIRTYTTNLIEALEKRGADFLVAVPEEFPDLPRTLRVASSGYSPLPRLLWEQTVWRQIVKREKADVLFSSANFGLLNCPVPQLLLLREGGLFDPLYLSTVAPAQGIRVALQRYMRRRLMLLSARANQRIITPTHAMREMFLAWMPELAERCSVNHYGTLTEHFRPAPRRPWRGDGLLKLLYVSIYYPHKNPADGVLACEALTGMDIRTKFTLTMGLESICPRKGAARDCYHVTRGVESGLVDARPIAYADLPATYAEHDIFIFPSVSETFGHPMVEAMASGIPVIAVDAPVNREVLGDCALYYPPFRPSKLVECVMQLDQDPELRHRLVERGRERVMKMFIWDDHVDRLLSSLSMLAGQPSQVG